MTILKYTNHAFTTKEGGLSIKEYNSAGDLVSNIPDTHGKVSVNWTNFRRSENDLNWRNKIKSVENATNPLHGERRALSVVPGDATAWFHRKSDGTLRRVEEYSGAHVFPALQISLPNNDLSVARNLAYKHAYRQLSGIHTSFQGGVFAGELRETLHMLRHRGRQIFDGVRNYFDDARSIARKFPHKKQRKNIRTALADTWLEYSFGWIPLASDISDAAKALKKIERRHDVVTRVTSVGTQIDQDAVINEYTHIGDIPSFRRRYQQGNSSVKIILGIKTDSQTGSTFSVNDTLQRFGLTVSSFVPTLWELTPWSFLVDYFTNLGDIIEAGFTSETNVAWSCTITRQTYVELTVLTADTEQLSVEYPSDDVTFLGTLGSALSSAVVVDRDARGISTPSFRLEIPGFDNPGDRNKWFNMAALANSSSSARNIFNRLL